MLDFNTCKVKKIKDETINAKRFFLEIQNTTNFEFEPGQFITLDLPIHEKKNKRLRSYSIASAPNGTNTIELVISYVPDGLGTNYLFKQVEEGTILNYRGALGHFTLPNPLPTHLYLICTGTGIAPFRSMVHHLQNKQNVLPNNITLIYGTRHVQDILYYNEFLTLQQNLKGLTYIPVLSRENWDGQKGYVHEVYKKLIKQLPSESFMLCGWRNMIDEAKKNLLELGYTKDQIHLELYG